MDIKSKQASYANDQVPLNVSYVRSTLLYASLDKQL